MSPKDESSATIRFHQGLGHKGRGAGSNNITRFSAVTREADTEFLNHLVSDAANHFDGEANSIKQRQEFAVRKGDPPTRFLRAPWCGKAEDALWALFNSPEMVLIP